MKITQRKIDTITPYENNPRQNDNAVEAVAKSITEFGFRQPIVVDADGVIIAGHTRYKAAMMLGLDKLPVHVAEGLSPEQVRAYRIADNASGELAKWDKQLLPIEISELQQADFDLSLLGFDEDTLENFLVGLDDSDASADGPPVETDESLANADAMGYIEAAEHIIVQFSGGKDSSLVLNWAAPILQKLGKSFEAVFVETGAEFPDLTPYIIRFCESRQVPLRLLQSRENIILHWFKKNSWPDSKYRDCIHGFINDAVNRVFVEREKEFGVGKVLIMRGGRSDQKTTLSKSNLYQEVGFGKHTARLLNPFFNTSAEEYDAQLEKLRPQLWNGYELGFIRTACWACPFQRKDQWDALKKHYPLLAEEMKRFARRFNWKQYKGDKTFQRMRKYWLGDAAAATDGSAIDDSNPIGEE
ncbi:MAG: ParB N-terminal domain-containing protein [Anaerohalosphaeraceae bacterium]|nr:ParB N-terminal domain-containing protein [Anaerohalosphaeraceae bacterium]